MTTPSTPPSRARGVEPGPVVDTRRSPFARHRSLPLAAVRIEGGFWGPRLDQIRRVTLPRQYETCEATGRIDNFRRAAGRRGGEYQGRVFNDSDLYKWLEAAALALATGPDAGLARRVEEGITEIAAAQAPDGYLHTYHTLERAGQRWTDLPVAHELYCAGHLIQAAVAHHRATGSPALLDIATRLADCISATFGPGRRRGTDGHEEVEMALVELYRETGRRAYLETAAFLLDERGQPSSGLAGLPYYQDHRPIREQDEIVGHAVRATYLTCGMADLYAETGDAALLAALKRLWTSAFMRKAYVTGGLGARWEGEAFGADHELPNERAYAETCAAIGGFMWNWRMVLLTGEARFADWMETALYNGILSGLSLDGTAYFYQNPLADRGGHRRQPWFATACCPPNIARLLLALPGYVATVSGDGLFLHHYARGTVGRTVPGGAGVTLAVETRYPWDGRVRIEVLESPAAPWPLHLRVPAWAEAGTLRVTGRAAPASVETGTYAHVERAWRAGDLVELELPMPVRRLHGSPVCEATAGRVALARGPLVYCIEQADRPARDVWGIQLERDATFVAEEVPELLGGVTVLRGHGIRPPGPPRIDRFPVTAIPYYAWANREPGPMQVWIEEAPGAGRPGRG
jgi:DUF1680 family protein